MSFARFVWLLEKRALYFRRSDLFDDPYEGYYTEPMISQEYIDLRVAAIRQKIPELDPVTFREHYLASLQWMKDHRKDFFINCWHLNELESSAMWRIYAPVNEAVCIRSTYCNLSNALPTWVDVGLVRYLDYKRDFIDDGNIYHAVMSKRASFAHENEVRAVLWRQASDVRDNPEVRFSGDDQGLVVGVEPTELISEVYLSPSSTLDFREAVEGVSKRFGLGVVVRQSEVNAPPAY